MSDETRYAAHHGRQTGPVRSHLRLVSAETDGLLERTRVEISPERERVRVTAAGALDRDGADQLDATMVELLESGFDHVVLDLRHLASIDGHGLQVILGLYARTSALNARLDVLGGPAKVAGLLYLAGLDTLPESEVQTSSRRASLKALVQDGVGE